MSDPKYIFTASMDVDPDKEDIFNEIYDTDHIPILSAVPGVHSITRYVNEPLTMILGGERREMIAEGEPKYSAVYEIDGPEVLVSDAWAAAVDKGRWTDEVRPYTHNRRHVLRKIM